MVKLKVTQSEIKKRIKNGELIDITNRPTALSKGTVIAVSRGTTGINGAIIRGATGKMYGIVGRTAALFKFI